MKNFLSSFQAQLAWILPMFVFVTGYVVLNDIRTPILAVATFVAAAVPFVVWVLSGVLFLEKTEVNDEVRRMPSLAAWFIFGLFFSIFLLFLPLGVFVHFSTANDFPGDKLNLLFCNYSIGVSTAIAIAVLIIRYFSAKKPRLFRNEVISSEGV